MPSAKPPMDEAFARRSREDSLWLVTYPKSGNTWLRFVTFHVLMDRAPASSRELDAMINTRFALPESGPLIKKSHATREALSDAMGKGTRVIYMHRHPLDVMQSALNYALLTGEIVAADRDGWVDAFLRRGGNPLWIAEPFSAGTWAENVLSWKAAPGALMLSYERCLSKPRKMVRLIADYLGKPMKSAALDAAADATSFTSLRAFETREIEKLHATGAAQGRFTGLERQPALEEGRRFFNRGTVGSYREVFGASELKRAWRVFRPVAEALGYTYKDNELGQQLDR